MILLLVLIFQIHAGQLKTIYYLTSCALNRVGSAFLEVGRSTNLFLFIHQVKNALRTLSFVLKVSIGFYLERKDCQFTQQTCAAYCTCALCSCHVSKLISILVPIVLRKIGGYSEDVFCRVTRCYYIPDRWLA